MTVTSEGKTVLKFIIVISFIHFVKIVQHIIINRKNILKLKQLNITTI